MMKIDRSRRRHHQTELMLREREELYKTLVAACPDAVMVTDLEGRITELSHRTLELHGFTREDDLLGKNILDLIAPKDCEQAMNNLQKTLVREVMKEQEYTMLRKDETCFIGELNTALVKDAYGKPKGFIATTRDITQRKQTEQALEESELKYHTLVEKENDGIYILQDNRFVYVNGSFCKILGYSEDEIKTLDSFLELVAYESKGFIDSREKKLERGENIPSHCEFSGKKKNGKKVYFEANISSIIYKGRPARLGILRDISERKEHEKRLLHVIDNTSHLINTPLTVALGYIDMVKHGRKEMAPELVAKVHEKLSEIRVRVNDEMVRNIYKLTVPTSDGWTPV